MNMKIYRKFNVKRLIFDNIRYGKFLIVSVTSIKYLYYFAVIMSDYRSRNKEERVCTQILRVGNY